MSRAPVVTRRDLSVVVPLFNEEENVEELHRQITAALEGEGLDYEMLLVDDGSEDRTFGRLSAIAGRDPRVRAVRFARNYGQTAAIQAGFDLAEGRVVVTMDGDLQNDPADIPALVQRLDEGFDLVSGWRRHRQDAWLVRKLPSVVANGLIGRLTGVRIRDNGCTLKAYRAELVKRTRLYADMHRFLAPMLSLSGCRYTEMAVNHRARRAGVSKYGLSRIWKVLLDLLSVKMLLRFATHPAAWFAVLAFPFAVGTSIAGAVAAWLYAVGRPAGEFAIVVPSVAFLLAVTTAHLLLLGMLAELVTRSGDYRETDPVLVRVEGRKAVG